MTWLTPLALTFALSLRTPDIATAPFDYLIAGDSRWSMVQVMSMVERENGNNYFGYNISGNHGLFYGFTIEYRTRIINSKQIDRQSIIIGRKWWLVGIGAGGVAEQYSNPKGAVDFWIPLPGGELSFTTDFARIHVWEGESKIGYRLSEKIEPYLAVRVFIDGNRRFWQVMSGVTIKLRKEANDESG